MNSARGPKERRRGEERGQFLREGVGKGMRVSRGES